MCSRSFQHAPALEFWPLTRTIWCYLHCPAGVGERSGKLRARQLVFTPVVNALHLSINAACPRLGLPQPVFPQLDQWNLWEYEKELVTWVEFSGDPLF